MLAGLAAEGSSDNGSLPREPQRFRYLLLRYTCQENFASSCSRRNLSFIKHISYGQNEMCDTEHTTIWNISFSWRVQHLCLLLHPSTRAAERHAAQRMPRSGSLTSLKVGPWISLAPQRSSFFHKSFEAAAGENYCSGGCALRGCHSSHK